MDTENPQAGSDATVFGALALVATAAHDVVLATSRETHRAIAERAHRTVRHTRVPFARSIAQVQNGLTAGVYGAVGLGLRAAGAGFDALSRSGVGARLKDVPRGRRLTSAVNGVLGDELARTASPLALTAAVRRNGRDVVLTDAGIAENFPAATGRVVIFVHGLCEDETSWERPRADASGTYADALERLGWTSVQGRLNTGISVRGNGVRLADLVDQLVAAWPVQVDRVAFVGHSQGGLVVRAATAGPVRAWHADVSDVITLGTPHLGSPVAKAARDGSRLLHVTPESAAFSTYLLERRSIGIRDLAAGSAFEPPPLPHVRYRVVAATVSRSPSNPFGDLVGDLLVRPGSATGRERDGREIFPGAERLVVRGVGHQALLNHAEVEAAMVRWLA